MLGAVAGDIMGSLYEHSRVKLYELELMPRRSRFTDDSVMTLAVARWLMDSPGHSHEDLVHVMQDLGRMFPDAGYGYNFKGWLMSDDPQPYNSWGNGAAMRVSPVGLFAGTLDEALSLAKTTAEVSHNHPDGIIGAQAVATSVWMAKRGHPKMDIQNSVSSLFGYDLRWTIDEIRPSYQWDISCRGSVPESIMAFLDGNDFVDVVRKAISLGGDADTMACIAGSIAACVYPIPGWIVERCEALLPHVLRDIMKRFENVITH